jgi:hypothetical protein
MKLIKQLIAFATLAVSASAFANAPANEAPDALVKRISADVIETAKTDKEIQAGNTEARHGPGRDQDPALRRLRAHDLAGRRPPLARRHPGTEEAAVDNSVLC